MEEGRGGGGGEKEEGGDVGYVRDCLPEVTLILSDFDSVGKARKRPLWQISVFIFLSPGRHAAPVPFPG